MKENEREFDHTLIPKHRKLLGVSQEALANYLGVKRETCSRYENGKYSLKDILPKILDFLSMKDKSEMMSNGVDEFGMFFKKLEPEHFQITVPYVRVNHYKNFIYTYNTDDSHIIYPSDRINIGYMVSFEVKERSMDNGTRESLMEGDIAICLEVPTEDFISENKNDCMWVFMLSDEIIIRKVKTVDTDSNRILCTALNTSIEYSDFSLDVDSVKKIFRVIGRILKY